MKKLSQQLILLALICFGNYVFAQNTVTGTVTDAETGETLIGVNILLKNTLKGDITDFDGNYTMEISEELPYSLVFSLIGYGTQTVEVTDANANLNVQLGTESILANEIVVSASRVEESILQSPVTVEKLDLIAIKQSASADYYDEITKLKGVHSNKASLTFNSINARGFAGHGNTRFVQLQDGMDNAAPLLNFPTGNIVGISELDVRDVELIPGAASALYGPNAFNGILIMNSKSPFDYQGLSAQIKTGVTDGNTVDPFYGVSVRYAKALNDKFAFKFNVSTFIAQDWEANDYSTDRNLYALAAKDPSIDPLGNVGGANFDGMNVYGDESPIPVAGGIRRTGFREDQLAESRDATSYKYDAELQYRISDNLETNVAYKRGSGSTVYQGSERYALRGFTQEFLKWELNSSKWNLRAYVSATDDGDSYNMTALGAFVNEGVWESLGADDVFGLPAGWAVAANVAFSGALAPFGVTGGDASVAKAFADAGGLTALAPGVREAFGAGFAASQGLPLAAGLQFADNITGTARPADGSADLNERIERVRNGLFQSGGAGFIDDSKMYHVEGNYDVSSIFGDALDVQIGGNFRRYDLFTDGTIFNERNPETGENERIGINEFGGYAQFSKTIMDERLKFTGSMRFDKNENFKGQVSPRISMVYSAGENKNHNIRASYQTGFRNPTTQGQYIYFPTTNILLGGTKQNAERYGIYEGGAWSEASYNAYVAGGSTDASLLTEQYLDYVQPEKLQAFEIGYKGVSNNKLMMDMSVFYNIYNDFINQQNVISKAAATHVNGETIPANSVYRPYFNAPVNITSYGVSIGADYLLTRNWKLTGNYTYNDFSLDDDIPSGFEAFDPGFNTPTNKINLGIGNRRITKNMSGGLSVSYQNEHFYTSSFGEGQIPAFALIDAQIGYKLSSIKSTIKLGVNNILKKEYFTNIGAPIVGRMVHLTITYDQFSN